MSTARLRALVLFLLVGAVVLLAPFPYNAVGIWAVIGLALSWPDPRRR